MYGDPRETSFEILAVVIILSLISSVCGLWDISTFRAQYELTLIHIYHRSIHILRTRHIETYRAQYVNRHMIYIYQCLFILCTRHIDTYYTTPEPVLGAGYSSLMGISVIPRPRGENPCWRQSQSFGTTWIAARIGSGVAVHRGLVVDFV